MKITLTILLCALLCGTAFAQTTEMTRRMEFRKRLNNPATREAAIQEGLKDEDAVIRKKALFEIFSEKGIGAEETLRQLAPDTDRGIQLLLIACIKTITDLDKRTELAKYVAENATSDEMKRDARRLLTSFTLNKTNVRLKDNPTYDHDVKTIEKIPIPDDNWLIIKDVVENGHEKGYFKSDLDDKDWQKIKIGAWEQQCIGNYDGVAWYRIRFKAPEKAKGVAGAELYFQGVDEIAWIWLNDVYVGQHDIGPSGWDIPFFMNIGDEIKWGEENLLVVRVHDSVSAGGIWKPIELHILQ